MNRIVALVVLLACVGPDALAQPPGGLTPAQGVKIVSTSELRALPGVPPEEAARLLAPRKQNVPPDGVARLTIYVKGSAIRIEHTTSPDGRVTISPAGKATIYEVSAHTKTYWTRPLSDRDGLASRMDVKSTPTGDVDTVASFPAEEVRFSARYLRRTLVRDPPRPSANRADGYTDPESLSVPTSAMSAELDAADQGLDGRAWLVTLPGGADARKLATMASGYQSLVPASRGRYPARLTTRTVGLRLSPTVELHETVETIEVLPLDDQLFQVPEGFRKVPMPRPSPGQGRLERPRPAAVR